jgi:hypothetical protein
MYDTTDPRSTLAPSASASSHVASHFVGAEFGRFYESAPQISDLNGRTWMTRGQNFLVAYTIAAAGARFVREDQPDESILLLPEPSTRAQITALGETQTTDGYVLVIVPPGRSEILLPEGGILVRIFTTRASDLAAMCENAASYIVSHPNIPAFKSWPEPKDGFKIRVYSLDVADQPGRFGRIWRCSTLMINFLPPQIGPRDIRKLSPHHHDDFEQGSLVLGGMFTHHLRWPWTVDMTQWRSDEHALCGAPSLTVIPPPAIHTSRGMDEGLNLLVDIFSPPRLDFSEKPGWVLNEADYPVPS